MPWSMERITHPDLHARAQELRARAMAALVRKAWHAVLRWRLRRRVRARLERLEPRLLDDIGLRPEEIPAHAARVALDRHPMMATPPAAAILTLPPARPQPAAGDGLREAA